MTAVSCHAMPPTPGNEPAPALKEWAVICHALLAGEQIIDLRKGGLREDGKHFDVAARKAWLYPTAVHQQADLLKPAYRHWIDIAPAAPVGEPIVVNGWVEIVESVTITEPGALDAIAGNVIWTADYAASRLQWKARDPLWVLILRAHRLLEPLTVAWAESYGGCTSWVTLVGLPADPASLPSEPALGEPAWQARLGGIRNALAR
jgi:hypothetical protein